MATSTATPIIGAAPPPPGVTPNFVNPPQDAHDTNVFIAVGLAFAGLFLVMRLYTKSYILRAVGWEEGMSFAQRSLPFGAVNAAADFLQLRLR